jgi:hydroxymethylpyrimidine pyrophosphatase-like HAD family hydrolase
MATDALDLTGSPLGSEESLKRQSTIAVDFDGVLADYDGWKGAGVLGEVRRDVVEALNVLRREGWKIIIHTTRSEESILEYLTRNNVPYDEINRNSSYPNSGPKPLATVYWDDRAVRYSGDAFRDLDTIRNFQTWSGRR